MKNLGSLLLGLIIGALIMYFYCCNSGGLEGMEPGITKPDGVITQAEGEALDRAFNSRHALISNNIVKRPDNRSSWWSMEDIRDYLDYAENQAGGLGYTMDGIRVYLGAYPDIKGVVGYTTMFIAPTGTKKLPEGTSNFAAQIGGADIPGADPLNMGGGGTPPNSNYPQ